MISRTFHLRRGKLTGLPMIICTNNMACCVALIVDRLTVASPVTVMADMQLNRQSMYSILYSVLMPYMIPDMINGTWGLRSPLWSGGVTYQRKRQQVDSVEVERVEEERAGLDGRARQLEVGGQGGHRGWIIWRRCPRLWGADRQLSMGKCGVSMSIASWAW